MNSKDYWAKRAAQDMVDRMGTAEQTAAEISAAVGQSSKYLAGEVKAVLRGIEGFGISEAEAIQIIRAAGDGNALQRFRRIAQQAADPERRRALMNAIDSAGAYRYRIKRIGELYSDIDSTCRRLYQTQNRLTTAALRNVAEDSYYHTIFNLQQGTGLRFSFSKFSRKSARRILRANWLGGNYSRRIWKDMSGLSERLKQELLVSMLTGRSGEKTARIFMERFGVNAYCARRIVRTESAYVANAAVDCGYEEAGIERYIFVATLDAKTSEVCAELDGKSFPRNDAVPGTNYPPMHPFCRSTTIADFGEDTLKGLERRAKDADGNTIRVPANMTYEEWYRKYVEGIEQPSIETREAETAALPGGRQVQIAEHQTAPALIAEHQTAPALIAEHQTAPALLTTNNSGGQTLTNVLNSGTISTRILNPVPQSQVVNILRQDSDDWINLLTDEELRAVRKYTKNSGDTSRPFFYERLNAMLRGAIPEDSRLRYYADTISSALKKNTLKHDILCYRRDSTDIFAGLSEGDEFIIHSFFSTSATPKGALNKGILCKIHIPAGAEGAYIEQLSSFPNQREFLLDKGQKYRVLSRKDDLIELEVVINEQ